MKFLFPTILFLSLIYSDAEAQFAGGSGTEENPWQVETLEQLQLIADTLYLDQHFIQIADIDAGEEENGTNFNPIGESESPFTGTYDGNGFIISGLTINLSGANGAGLFGYAENARIKNTGLVLTTVSGNRFVGGLAGWFRGGWISNSFCKCTISADGRAGGLVGYNWSGEISDSYVAGDISGNFRIGGLVGVNVDNGSVSTSYAGGKVTGNDHIGGLVGQNDASVINSYWDMEATGQNDGIGFGDTNGATGRTTSEMTGASAYDYMPEFDFRRVWLLTEGYPALNWEDVQAIEPPELEAPPMVELISPEDEAIINHPKPDFYWNEARDAFSYQIQIATDEDFDSLLVDNQELEETFYPAEDSLPSNTPWFWRVRGINPAGKGEWSETRSFTILDTPFAGGSGTESDPWHISSVEQLQDINEYPESHFLQVRDIHAGHTEFWNDGKGFKQIGWRESGDHFHIFSGTFDGGGFEISGLVINRAESYLGLFGYTEEARIKNISLVEASISGASQTGGLVGWMRNGTIKNSHFSGEVTGGSNTGGLVGRISITQIEHSSATGYVLGGMSVGGLIGRNSGSDITDSYARVEVSQRWSLGHAGGLIGLSSGNIENSYAVGNVTSSNSYIGGLIGSHRGLIKNSFSEGNVSGEDRIGGLIGENRGEVRNAHATGNVSGRDLIGGLIGKNFSDVHDSYAAGEVAGKRETGGLTGLNTGNITRSHAAVDVTGYVFTGGLVGRNQRNITSSYAGGDVSGNGYVGGLTGSNAGISIVQGSYSLGSVEGEQRVGGLAGANLNDAQIHHSFSAGNVSGDEETGGFLGFNDANLENSYWNTESSELEQGIGSGASTGATGLTTDQMTGESAFNHMTDFDFYNFWLLTESYPALFWEEVTAVPPPPITVALSSPANEQTGLPVRDTLRWQKSDRIDEYQLQISTSEDFSNLIADSTLSDSKFAYELEYETTWYWRVKALYMTGEGDWSDIWSFETVVSTSAGHDELPVTYKLHQNYPNPFNPVTVIRYELPENNEVLIEIYDILGRRVAVLVNDMKKAGVQRTVWDASNVASGTYLYRLQAGDFIQSRSMLLVK